MIKLDNARMLMLFAKTDENHYFYDCHDITMAGKDGYKIKEIAYFVKDESDPLADYACFKTYYDDSVVVYLYAKDETFVGEIAAFLLDYPATEIDLSTPYAQNYELSCIKDRFTFCASENGAPTYALCDAEALPPFVPLQNVTVSLSTDSDKAQALADPTWLDALEEDLRTPDLFDACPCFSDTRFYLLKEGDKIIGFLRAECGYRNFYDVGWVYVAPSYRGNGYGKLLTLYFAHDCLQNGLYPHYGYAISKESAAVARRCGFACTHPSRTFKKLERKIPL